MHGLGSTTDSAPTTDTLISRLLNTALLRGTFTLRSGQTSNVYFDKYRVITHPGFLLEVAAAFDELRREVAPTATHIVAPALGGVPLATALSMHCGLPFSIVRVGGGKGYGTDSTIEGGLPDGCTAVLVEDVVTSGGAACAAIEAATAAGAHVCASLCLLDRGAGGADALAALGAPLRAVISAGDFHDAVQGSDG